MKVCGDSLALVELNDGSTIYFNKETEVTFSSKTYPLVLDSGKLFAMMKPQKSVFEIKTPSAVLGVIGTEFDAEVTENRETILKVKKGKVSYSNDTGNKIVGKRYQAKAGSGAANKSERIHNARDIDVWTKPINTKKTGK